MRISKASSGNYGAGFIWNATGTLTIKNITFDKASVCKVYNSHNVVGIVVGYTYGTTVFDHVKVTNSGVYGFGKVGVLLGMGADPGVKVTFSNCESTGNTIYARYDAGGLAGNIQRAQKNGVAEAEANVQITGCVVDHNTFISSAPSSTEELNTKVAADDTAGDAPCVLTGKTISGPSGLTAAIIGLLTPSIIAAMAPRSTTANWRTAGIWPTASIWSALWLRSMAYLMPLWLRPLMPLRTARQ